MFISLLRLEFIKYIFSHGDKASHLTAFFQSKIKDGVNYVCGSFKPIGAKKILIMAQTCILIMTLFLIFVLNLKWPEKKRS
jgi:hypothetical protein